MFACDPHPQKIDSLSPQWRSERGNQKGWIWQQLPDPTGGDEIYRFGNVTILEYAGDNLWSFQEDVYNPNEASEMIQRWLAAGGTLG